MTGRPGTRRRTALYSSANAFLTTAVIGAVALGTGQPLLFPSLGPTAFLLFAQPHLAPASPRNTVLGHLIGVLAGATGLAVFDLWRTAPDLTHVTWARTGAAALALALTCGAMTALAVPHPPAGATTLIVSLGLLRTPAHLAILMVGVIGLTTLGYLVNRLAGVPYPIWRPVAATPDDRRPEPHRADA
ncbi:HPP family protein [Saccharothrix australiensis]|uniref:HPP family protein n=1 Tax=Saccharothrix australiensis TaxID=2072 RepID=A0A495VZJ5_9PSEU|nr:HPP family protein [Saccharothrix australiensis]RKT53805.1 HPP family protein [Saccharothrix australiensis]